MMTSTQERGEGPSPYSQALLRVIPKVGPVAAQLRQELHDREQRRDELFRTEVSGRLDLDELAESIIRNERFGDLLRDAVEAARRTHDEHKIRVLAAAFADGTLADDEALIDEAEQLLRVVSALDSVQLRALSALRNKGREYGSPQGCLIRELQIAPALANLLFHQLQQFGLVETEQLASYDPEDDSHQVELDESWGLSATGNELVRLLEETASS